MLASVGRRLGPERVLRWAGLVWLAVFVVLLINDPGRMVFDTKLSVDLDPAAYYASLWHMWDPRDTLGTLDNQSVGYAVPMAPFYLAGQLAHVPVWITERLWMSLIVAVGFAGLTKLAAALRIGSPVSRLVAGLVFALWPTFTIVIGSTSAAVLPGMLAPWAVLPLCRATGAARRDHPASWWMPGPRGPQPLEPPLPGVLGAAARSGVAVLCMGGVNATSTVDALLLPGLFIVTHARGRRLVGLTAAWLAAVIAATAWWAVPLLLQGKYAFNFLPYVEQANTTTSTMSAAATLRGAGNWTAYFNLGTPWLSAGWALVTIPFAIVAAAVAAGCGLYGLATRGMPEGLWLRLSAGSAAFGALAGYSGPLGGPFHAAVRQLLDGPLAPFRNVYKFEPVIAAALALGLAHTAASWLQRLPGEAGNLNPPSVDLPDRKALPVVARVMVGLVLIGLALPYLSNRVLNPGSFTAVPAYWNQVASFLAAQSPRNPALVVPADAHGDYLWGDPIDDPLVALARSPWAQRSLVPYGGAGGQALLQTAENAIESGEQVNGLAAYLTRAGIRYLVVRNDLSPQIIGYTSPVVVHQTLALSGFTRVASFGPPVTGAQTTPQATPLQTLQPSYPAVEIYAAAGAAPPLSPVTAVPVSQTVLVNGGPDALLQLAGQNLLSPGQPAIIAGDAVPAAAAQWAVTDGQRRADNVFGLVNSNVSFTYTATETNPADDQFGGAGGPPRQLLPVAATGHQTVAVLSGAASVTASSYGSWLTDTEQEDPASAFDGNPATAWTEGSARTPVGQWIQVAFDHPVDLPASIGIRLLDDSGAREIASKLRISTAAGTTTANVAATGAAQKVAVTPGRTGWLRITIEAASGVAQGEPGAGISDVQIPGVTVTRMLQPAQDPAGQRAGTVSFSFQQQVPSPFTFADPAATPPMARTFTTPRAVTMNVRAAALAVPGPGLDALLDRIAAPGKGVVQVSVASTSGSLPARFPASLLTGSGTQPWIAESTNPVIHLSWQGKRRITSMVVAGAIGSSTPETVKISSPDGSREAVIGFTGLAVFSKPLVTNRIDVSFPQVKKVTATVSSGGQAVTLPVGLSRLSVPALAGLRVVAPDQAARFTLACGTGPAVTIDGRVYQTSVSGTIGQLSRFLPLRVSLCTPRSAGTLALGSGRHTLAAAPGTFVITDLSMTDGPAASAPAAPSRAVTVGGWGDDQRQLTIGAGPASYLEIHENDNPGWTATLNGHALTPVRLDGWQQGFLVPAGAGGTVLLSYQPTAAYRFAFAASALAVGILFLFAAWPALALYRVPLPGYRRSWPRIWRFRPVAWQPAQQPARRPGRRARGVGRWLGVLAVTALIAVVGGPLAFAVPVLAVLSYFRVRWLLSAVAGTAMVVSGLLAATAVTPNGPGQGVFGAGAQACALLALACALIPASRPEPDATPAPETTPDTDTELGLAPDTDTELVPFPDRRPLSDLDTMPMPVLDTTAMQIPGAAPGGGR